MSGRSGTDLPLQGRIHNPGGSGAPVSLALVPAIVDSESDTPLPVDAGTPARASLAEEQRTYRTHLSRADANRTGLSPLAVHTHISP